jgi:hypothetical protein
MPLVKRHESNINLSTPNLTVLGAPTASDEKAARVEQMRREKGIYWQGANLAKVESTFVEGIYAYYDAHGKCFAPKSAARIRYRHTIHSRKMILQ